MPRYFMSNTPMKEIEILMQQPPNHKPRRSGVRVYEKTRVASDKRTHSTCVEDFINLINDRRLTERVNSVFSHQNESPL